MPRARTLITYLVGASQARSYPAAARNAADTLKKATRLLLEHPALGKRLEEREDRELFIPFGQRGYILRYRLEDETLVILRIWHGLEARSSGPEASVPRSRSVPQFHFLGRYLFQSAPEIARDQLRHLDNIVIPKQR